MSMRQQEAGPEKIKRKPALGRRIYRGEQKRELVKRTEKE